MRPLVISMLAFLICLSASGSAEENHAASAAESTENQHDESMVAQQIYGSKGYTKEPWTLNGKLKQSPDVAGLSAHKRDIDRMKFHYGLGKREHDDDLKRAMDYLKFRNLALGQKRALDYFKHMNIGLGKRGDSGVVGGYKRAMDHFRFQTLGLGKRGIDHLRQQTLGLGKRNTGEDEKRGIDHTRFQTLALGKRNEPISDGLKRGIDHLKFTTLGLGKREDNVNAKRGLDHLRFQTLGLGKRGFDSLKYHVGLGKRDDVTDAKRGMDHLKYQTLALGKRHDTSGSSKRALDHLKFQTLGLGKRDDSNKRGVDHLRFHTLGLGKRDISAPSLQHRILAKRDANFFGYKGSSDSSMFDPYDKKGLDYTLFRNLGLGKRGMDLFKFRNIGLGKRQTGDDVYIPDRNDIISGLDNSDETEPSDMDLPEDLDMNALDELVPLHRN